MRETTPTLENRFFVKFGGKFFISKLIIVLFACFNKKKQTPAE